MPYETITIPAESRFRLKTTDVGFAGVHLRITPAPEHTVQIKSEITPSEVTERFMEACFEGIRECLENGPIEGHPIQGVEVTLLNAEYHPDDSTEAAFRRAGNSTFADLFRQADPIVIDD